MKKKVDRKEKTIEVSVDSYRNMKLILNSLKKRKFKPHINRKIRYFEQLAKGAKSKTVRTQFEKEFRRFLGIRKDGSIGVFRKAELKRGNGTPIATIRIRNRKKKSAKKLFRLWNENDFNQENWAQIKEVLIEYNAFDYFDFFYSDMYPSWVDRLKKRLGFDDMPSQYFLELIYEGLMRWG